VPTSFNLYLFRINFVPNHDQVYTTIFQFILSPRNTAVNITTKFNENLETRSENLLHHCVQAFFGGRWNHMHL